MDLDEADKIFNKMDEVQNKRAEVVKKHTEVIVRVDEKEFSNSKPELYDFLR